MRPYLAVSLLLWSLLLSEAQGIRLDKKYNFMSQGQQKVHEDGSDLMKKTNSGAGDQVTILCKDGHCSSGKNRKLITTTTSTTTTITTTSKNEISGQDDYNKADLMSKGQSGGNGEHGEKQTFMVSGKPTSDEHHEIAHEHFPDNTDIADMDYSPAKRKPPIHN
ncbi:uncharacterized protein LOC122297181 isoform X2 [Carya illinoinensis]|uniref:Uncharacterized protein n=1 Tax=Carya illinoinensis TaxID=32201 RepID=A0A8T1NGG7_CARIL|nr:uncharacterized protein LOC122297181 isoform X2 [Carya illinoinensis]KAG6628174.1 hypothetical protein CIPAW_15G183400 [Carya illinoinensis]KAG6676751.1 hypothetical protein I3842_15G167300 [Carya illinoinensis]